MADSTPEQTLEDSSADAGGPNTDGSAKLELAEAVLHLPYVPDFLMEDVRFWFAPTREAPTAVYLELRGASGENWTSYYNRKAFQFFNQHPRPGEGPYRVADDAIHLRILEPGRLFAPKPQFQFEAGGERYPVVNLDKRRPLNPWKPNYIQAVNFIKRYRWPHDVPRAVHYAVWEIEECGQIAGSTSWINGRSVLLSNNSPELRAVLSDIFFQRPEDYPLGSEVYLEVLGRTGQEGFEELCRLGSHPISRKRRVVTETLGKLSDPRGLPTLMELLEDEDPEVRRQALRSIGRVGLDGDDTERKAKVSSYLDSDELPERVWAAQALYRAGDKAQHKFLVGLVKEEPRLLTDMGELGEVLADLKLEEAVPYLINRLKSDKPEFRADAAEALEKVTGLDLEYQSLDTSEQRRNTIKTCTRWWDDRKKARKAQRDQKK